MIILDSSAAVDIVRETDDGKALASLMLTGESVISLELFYAEVSNAFWKYCKAGFYDERDAKHHITKAVRLVDEFHPMGDCYIEVFGEAARLRHSVYDMMYLVLARRNGATLFTLDRKLQQLCLENGVNCAFADAAFSRGAFCME